jgi:hypothetical protein
LLPLKDRILETRRGLARLRARLHDSPDDKKAMAERSDEVVETVSGTPPDRPLGKHRSQPQFVSEPPAGSHRGSFSRAIPKQLTAGLRWTAP